MAIGILVMSLLDNYCHHPTIHKKINKHGKLSLFFLLLYLFIICRVALALGTAFINHADSAIPFLIAIVVHHIPEGLALIIPFLFTKHKYISFLLTTLLLSLILGTGTVFGILMEGKTLHLQGLIMGSAIGSLGYVTIHEMLGRQRNSFLSLHF